MRQRDLRVGCERRVTARVDQPQPIVGDRLALEHGLDRLGLDRRGRDQLAQLDPPADRIDRLVPRDLRQPGARLVGRTLGGPARERGAEGVLDGFLGELEVTVGHPDRGREDACTLGAEHLVDRRRDVHAVSLAHATCRTS